MEIITLGIGTPATIKGFILLGLAETEDEGGGVPGTSGTNNALSGNSANTSGGDISTDDF